MNTPSEATLVTVTGASGFIALHCIRELLQRGYRVRGTLRNPDKQGAIRRALGAAGDDDAGGDTAGLTFVAADLNGDAGWDEAASGARFVIHTASPVPNREPKHADDVVVPAREGTLRMLRAASAAGVSRVVLTSSVAAVFSLRLREQGHVFTEADWCDPDEAGWAYAKSKILAERAAWQFVEGLPPERPLELVTLLPGFVLGPSLLGTDNSSNEVVRKLLERAMPGVPRFHLPVVDVRDVAAAHVLAMTLDAAAGERFILSQGTYWMEEIAAVLTTEGYRVPRRVLPDWLVRVASWFDPTVRLVVKTVGKPVRVVNDKAVRGLDWHPRDVKETVLDTAASIAARG